MTLDEILLQKLSRWRPESSQPALELADPASGWSVRVNAECVDQVGSRLTELGLVRATPLADDLAGRAAKIAAQVTGLLEPLRLLEVDSEHRTALLRSQEPGQKGEHLFYYEVLLQAGGSCSLRRFQAAHHAGARRQQVPFTLTHDALGKLVNDLTR